MDSCYRYRFLWHRVTFGIAVSVLLTAAAIAEAGQPNGTVNIEVTQTLSEPVPPGRLLVVVAPDIGTAEPRRWVGQVGEDDVVILGVDTPRLSPGERVRLDAGASATPEIGLAGLPSGRYRAQAVLRTNTDLRVAAAAGNLYSEPVSLFLDHDSPTSVSLRLTRRVSEEVRPGDESLVQFVRVRSRRLSEFHGRPIYLRAGVILPRGFHEQGSRRYPVRVHIGGYGTRYTAVRRMMRAGSRFRDAWLAIDAPPMILLHLDGAGPYGDPYQVNSANNGPYGDAVIQELIPHVEQEFRGIGTPGARVLDGGSTGGWVALALQTFYPDFFNGAWASCPDSVDFRAFQLVNIYDDESAYVDAEGRERPSARNRDGSVRFTMRDELQMENVLGDGDQWTMSGRQWGAWNAAYGPRGEDGHPIPLWDPESGRIDKSVIELWRQYDLRAYLDRYWTDLAPSLRGKLNVWVGELDDYFLEGAVHLLDEFLRAPSRLGIGARVTFGVSGGHCWTGLSEAEMMREMDARIRDWSR